MTLYRAASRATIAPATFGRGACFAQRREDAERYTRNPGFGGAHLFAFAVEPEYVLQVGRGRVALETLARELDFAPETVDRWLDAGLCEAYEVLEERAEVARRVAECYDWLVYEEPQAGEDGARFGARTCRTWRYFGSRPLVGRLS